MGEFACGRMAGKLEREIPQPSLSIALGFVWASGQWRLLGETLQPPFAEGWLCGYR